MSVAGGSRRAPALSLCAALAAALLFVLELSFGRLLLPRLGGSSGVWTTCLCFFQGTLLLGYLVAHGAQRFSPRTQGVGYLVLLACGALVLPFGLGEGWAPDPLQPVPDLLWALTRRVGLPFLALAAASPLLQAQAARLGARPQGVLAASNAGSLVGLLAYPLLLEPLLGLRDQAWVWTLGYGVLVALGALATRHRALPPEEGVAASAEAPGSPKPGSPTPGAPTPPLASSADDSPRLGEGEVPPLPWLAWCALAALPAALLYAVTTTLSTFFPPLPLLWVLPLALYLGGMSAAFARARRPARVPSGGALQGAVALTAALLLVSSFLLPALARRPTWLLAALVVHLLGFGLVAFGLHLQLAQRGPRRGADPSRVTRYNLAIACGGLTGGLLGGVAAPLLLQSAVEVPLLYAAALCLAPVGTGGRARLFACALTLPILVAGLRPGSLAATWPALALGLPLIVLTGRALSWPKLRVLSASSLLVAVGSCRPGPAELRSVRSLHGVHRVVAQDGFHHYLSSGVVHGRQSQDPAGKSQARAYFASEAPLGQVLSAWSAAHPRGHAAGVGLGIGGLLPHARAGQRWRFWELDPLVIALAEDPALFTYVGDARARGVEVELIPGDGRLGLARQPEKSRHDLLLIDAFSGDAVPLHLLTEEAFDLYLSRLKAGGLLVLHVSTRYLDLTPLLSAEAKRLGLHALQRREVEVDAAARAAGRTPSHCVVLSANSAHLDPLREAGWVDLPRPAARAWRDDRASLIEVLGLVRSGR